MSLRKRGKIRKTTRPKPPRRKPAEPLAYTGRTTTDAFENSAAFFFERKNTYFPCSHMVQYKVATVTWLLVYLGRWRCVQSLFIWHGRGANGSKRHASSNKRSALQTLEANHWSFYPAVPQTLIHPRASVGSNRGGVGGGCGTLSDAVAIFVLTLRPYMKR